MFVEVRLRTFPRSGNSPGIHAGVNWQIPLTGRKHLSPYTTNFDDLNSLLADFPTNPSYFYEHTVVSPMDYVQRECILAECESTLDLGPTVPCDVMIFGSGEPDDRHVT